MESIPPQPEVMESITPIPAKINSIKEVKKATKEIVKEKETKLCKHGFMIGLCKFGCFK